MAHVASEVRRQQFIEAAMTVIAREGVDRATTRRIADEAGAPLATLHYCFQTKENLLWAVFEQLTDLTSARVDRSRLEGQSAGSVAKLLLTDTVQWTIDNQAANRAQIEIWLWAERNDSTFAARMYDVFIDVWKGVLREVTGLSEDELDSVTRIMVALTDGFSMQLITHGDGTRILRELDTATAMLSAYLDR
jgi:AcrR family transcriptional regulator